jgi:hypothetical protein
MNYDRPVTQEEWSALREEHPFARAYFIADKIVQARLAEAAKELASPAAKPNKPAWTIADELGCIADIPCKPNKSIADAGAWDVIEIARRETGVTRCKSRWAALEYVNDVTLILPNDRRAYIIVPSARKPLDADSTRGIMEA